MKAALEFDAANFRAMRTIGLRAVSAQDTHWLWLLHDDAVPAPDALYQLLAHVTTDQSIDLTGPKLLLPRRRHGGQPISEIGVSISDTGRRELDLDVDEIDQGQRDQPQERLGVSTCGMLVRPPSGVNWTVLTLPCPSSGMASSSAGALTSTATVVTYTCCAAHHRQVGRAGLRPRGLTGRRPGKVDRLLGMLVVAGHAQKRMLPLVWLRLVWSRLVRAVGYLIGKVPGRALDEMLALGSFVAQPGRLRELRRRTAAIDPTPGTSEVVHSLRPPWWSGLRVGLDTLTGTASERYRLVAGDSDVATIDELTGDDFSSATDSRPKNLLLSPAAITVAVAVVASLIAARSLFGSGSLVAPALLPAHDSIVDLWRSSARFRAPLHSDAALGGACRPRVNGHVRPARMVHHAAVVRRVPLSLLAAYPLARRDQRPPRAALGLRHVRTASGAARWHKSGPARSSVVAIGLPLLVMAARALVLRRTRTAEARGWVREWYSSPSWRSSRP